MLNLGEKSVEESYPEPHERRARPHLYGAAHRRGPAGREGHARARDGLVGRLLPQPPPTWTPCPAREDTDEDFDMYLTSSRLALHSHR